MVAFPSPSSRDLAPPPIATVAQPAIALLAWFRAAPTWQLFAAAAFLVCGPVFIEAPLTRQFPSLCLGLTAGWLVAGLGLMRQPRMQVWGDLLVGFSATWLTGSLYWGWLRWQPLWHLPVEALALPLAIAGLRGGWGRVGSWFYLGSLLGTAITDGYFYVLDLFPFWRQAIAADPTEVGPILHAALAQMHTPFGLVWAIALAGLLLGLGLWGSAAIDGAKKAFGGAVLSTLLVDGLFWLAAIAS